MTGWDIEEVVGVPEDEFIYVLSGELTLEDESGKHRLKAESFCGFRAGVENGHHLINSRITRA